MNSWIGSSFAVPVLGVEYSAMRHDLVEMFDRSKTNAGKDARSYEADVYFATELYAYFKAKAWFNERLACDDGFWRYISLKVIPDLVGERWGNEQADHYYAKPSRIWPKSLWWYFHLSLKDYSVDETKQLLLSEHFSTDTILNLVERTGRYGTNLGVYRTIMSKYGALEDVPEKSFRKVMILNTAKSIVLEPTFFEGGVGGYVDSIFQELSLK
jgi:hypothetical protein